MIETITVSETLSLEIHTGHDGHLAISRDGGGLVRVEPSELRGLVAGLVCAAGVLASAVAARVVTTGPAGDGDRERGG